MTPETPAVIAFAIDDALPPRPAPRTAAAGPRRRRAAPVLPGFRTSAAITSLVVFTMIVFPLAVLVLRAASLGPGGFLAAAWTPRARAAYGVSLGASLLAATASSLLGLLVAWVQLLARRGCWPGSWARGDALCQGCAANRHRQLAAFQASGTPLLADSTHPMPPRSAGVHVLHSGGHRVWRRRRVRSAQPARRFHPCGRLLQVDTGCPARGGAPGQAPRGTGAAAAGMAPACSRQQQWRLRRRGPAPSAADTACC